MTQTTSNIESVPKCRKCNSEDLSFSKKIHEGKKQTQFHYVLHCNNCKTIYNTPRTKYIYEQVKDLHWCYSKNTYRRRAKKRKLGIDTT